MLGKSTVHVGDIIAPAGSITASDGRRFFGSPLVASLRATQKVEFDITAVKKNFFLLNKARADDTAPGRDAFIDLSHNMMLPERTAFSAGLTQLIASLATRLPPFIYHKPSPDVIACIEDICPTSVSKRLAELRVKHLEKVESVQSSCRAACAIQSQS